MQVPVLSRNHEGFDLFHGGGFHPQALPPMLILLLMMVETSDTKESIGRASSALQKAFRPWTEAGRQ